MSAERVTCPGCRYGECRPVASAAEVRAALIAGRDVGVFNVGGALQVHSYPRGTA